MMLDVIALDGPTAAGKTTTGRRIARHLDVWYLESGRTYRYVAHAALESGVDLADDHALSRVGEQLLRQPSYDDILKADDRDVRFLRRPDVTRAVSRVAAVGKLRHWVTEIIRSWASSVGPCVIEGRDIGTDVFPDAAVKIFLTATPDVRARRRHVQEPGQPYKVVFDDLMRRDQADSTRVHSPFTRAEGAYVIDTTAMTVDEVVRTALDHCGRNGFRNDASRGRSCGAEVLS
jgi:cytidylate kinase